MAEECAKYGPVGIIIGFLLFMGYLAVLHYFENK